MFHSAAYKSDLNVTKFNHVETCRAIIQVTNLITFRLARSLWDNDTKKQFVIDEYIMYLRWRPQRRTRGPMASLVHPSCVTKTISKVCTTQSQLRMLRSVTKLTNSTVWHSFTEAIWSQSSFSKNISVWILEHEFGNKKILKEFRISLILFCQKGKCNNYWNSIIVEFL